MLDMFQMSDKGGTYTIERNGIKVSRELYQQLVHDIARDVAVVMFFGSFGLLIMGSGLLFWAAGLAWFRLWLDRILWLIPLIVVISAMCAAISGAVIGRRCWRQLLARIDRAADQPSRETLELTGPAFTPELQAWDVVIPSEGGLPSATIPQPAPAAFPRWLRDVLASGETSRVQFSYRESVRRGYSRHQFNQLVAELRKIAWLERHKDSNGVHRLSASGAVKAQRWLDSQ